MSRNVPVCAIGCRAVYTFSSVWALSGFSRPIMLRSFSDSVNMLFVNLCHCLRGCGSQLFKAVHGLRQRCDAPASWAVCSAHLAEDVLLLPEVGVHDHVEHGDCLLAPFQHAELTS